MKKINGFTIITFVLIIFIALCTTKTVKSISLKEARTQEEYYQELEKHYIKQIRDYLSEEGFSNSGVTMTRVLTEEGKREYSVLIHNKRITNLSLEEKETLKYELNNLYSGMEECQICHNFLEKDL